MKRTFLLGLVGMMALVVAAAMLAADKTKSEEAFDRLASLKGEWKGELSGVKATLIYTLTADGSALMEEFRPEIGGVMITMFTVDGDHLIGILTRSDLLRGLQEHGVSAPVGKVARPGEVYADASEPLVHEDTEP